MKTEEKLALMKSRIEASLSPSHLEIIDESDQHIGHAGHQGGGRHFAVIIKAEALQSLNSVAAHRAIYSLFNDLMPHEIHALKIKVLK